MAELAADSRFWNRAAARYAADPIKDTAGYERTMERTAELLSASDSVIELGCGTGTTALRLAASVRLIHASDISEEMIAIARRKAEVAGCRNIRFSVGPADGPLAALLDAVLAFNVLHLVKDRAAVLAAAFQALKPGGSFITKTPCLSEMSPLIRLAVPLMRAIGKAPTVAFFAAAQLESDMEKAGFVIIERGRHGSRGKDARIFLVARKPV